MRYLLTLFLNIVVSTTFITQAQVETKYYNFPLRSSSFEKAKVLAKKSKIQRMPAFDLSELIKEDSILAGMDIPYRFGKSFPLSLTLNDGQRQQL